MATLDAVTQLLHGDGVTMLGHDIDDNDAIEYVRERSPKKPFCLVRQWIWIDLDMPDSVRDKLISEGLQPVMIYSHQVVFDSTGRFNPGDWVRSTPLLNFTDGCFFETRNTIYVLLGHGIRKSAELSTVIKIF